MAEDCSLETRSLENEALIQTRHIPGQGGNVLDEPDLRLGRGEPAATWTPLESDVRMARKLYDHPDSLERARSRNREDIAIRFSVPPAMMRPATRHCTTAAELTQWNRSVVDQPLLPEGRKTYEIGVMMPVQVVDATLEEAMMMAAKIKRKVSDL